MGKPGWIYLKKDVNTNGTARGYKFGLTSNKKRRDQGYTTENPSIVHLDYFETEDMKEAEDDLKQRVLMNDMRLYSGSGEWVHPDAYQRFMGVWERVKEKHKCGSEYIAKQKQKELDRIERERQEEEDNKRAAAEAFEENKLVWAEMQKQTWDVSVFAEQPKRGMPADLFIGLGAVLALPALVMLYYVFVAVSYAVKGIAAFWFQFGIPIAFLTVGVALCVYIYRYGMNLARERGEI